MNRNERREFEERRPTRRSVAAQLSTSVLVTAGFAAGSLAASTVWTAFQSVPALAAATALVVGLTVAIAVPVLASRCAGAAFARIDGGGIDRRDHDERSVRALLARLARR